MGCFAYNSLYYLALTSFLQIRVDFGQKGVNFIEQ